MIFFSASILSILLWSVFPAIASSIRSFNAIEMVVYAQVLSIFVWYIYLYYYSGSIFDIYKKTKNIYLYVGVSGLLNALEYILFFVALRISNPVLPTILFESWVIFMVIFNILVERVKVKLTEIVLILVAFLGVFVSVWDPGSRHMIDGDVSFWGILGLGAAICAGVKASLNTKIAEYFSIGEFNAVSGLIPHFLTAQVAVACYLVSFPLIHNYFNVQTILLIGSDVVVQYDVVKILVIGVLIMGAANPIFIYALRIRPSEAHAAVFYLIPIFAIFWLVKFGNHSVTYFEAIGGLITILSIVVISTKELYLDAMLGTSIVSLLSTYAMITVNISGFDIKIGDEEQYLLETSTLIFTLISVFAVERATTIRQECSSGLEALVSAFSKMADNPDSKTRDRIESVMNSVLFIGYSKSKDIPLKYSEEVLELARLCNLESSSYYDFEEKYYAWLDLRSKLFPLSHVLFIGIFGVVCIFSVILVTDYYSYFALFSLFVICGISYLFFYIWKIILPLQLISTMLRVFSEYTRKLGGTLFCHGVWLGKLGD